MKYDRIIKDFKDYLQQLGYTASSCFMLPYCIKSFLDYHHPLELEGISQEQITQFCEWLQIRPHKRQEGGLSEQYIQHHTYALKLFFDWLELSGQIRTNPISVMKFKRPEVNRREPLTRAEITQLFEAVETAEERAVLHLFYSCGLRRSEGVSLNIRDIYFKQQILYVRKGKGAKRRAVPMTYKVSHDLESYYLEERNQPNAKDPDAFMLNKNGKRMSGDSYNRRLKELAERAGIERIVTLHYLRHSIATHLLESGLQVEQVREFLGHSHLESTQVYAKVSENQLGKL